jgi:DNA-directed RNA polymerase specialized sigma24 family protein
MEGRGDTGPRLSDGASADGLPPEWSPRRRSGDVEGVACPLSDEPTQAGPGVAASPLDSAVGCEAVRRYEAALATLTPRDRVVVRGRIELQWSYDELAEAIGVIRATTARAAVTRALGRLIEAMKR